MKKNVLKILSVILCLSLVCGCFAFSASAETEGTEPVTVSAENAAAPTRISVVMNGDAQTSRGITWYTKEKTGSVVEIAAGVIGSAADCKINYSEVFEWEGNFVHKAVVSALKSGTEYFYTVGGANGVSEKGSFITDDGNDKFEFIAVADITARSRALVKWLSSCRPCGLTKCVLTSPMLSARIFIISAKSSTDPAT